jgi:3-oxoacyl-[acyl-carrier-protein] synthase III
VIGIKAIASYVPRERIHNRSRLAEFGVDETFIADKIGIEAVSRRAEDEDTADLCEKAFAQFKSNTGIEAQDIDCAVVCTQNPSSYGLPHTSALLHGRLGWPSHCACWDISLGCTGYVHGLSIVQAFMEAQNLRNGLLFTADPYSKIVDPKDRNTAMLFGDGATVTLLSKIDDEALLTPVATSFHTEGNRSSALENRNGRLHMDGRAVFNFSATAAPRQVDELLKRLGLTRADVDLYFFHQGSKYIVDTIRQRLGLDEKRAPLRLTAQGNLVSSSIPLMLQDYVERFDIKRVVLSGFGVGLAAAACVLERRGQ